MDGFNCAPVNAVSTYPADNTLTSCASKLSDEQLARFDTNGDGVIDATEMAAMFTEIKNHAAFEKLTKPTIQPSSYVKAELKSGNFKLKKVSIHPGGVRITNKTGSGNNLRRPASGFDTSKLTPEQFARFDTNGEYRR